MQEYVFMGESLKFPKSGASDIQMESQPQNNEFGNNPENFHPSVLER